MGENGGFQKRWQNSTYIFDEETDEFQANAYFLAFRASEAGASRLHVTQCMLTSEKGREEPRTENTSYSIS